MGRMTKVKPYRVGRSRISGLGLFATKPIKKGAEIIRYFGPLLDKKNSELKRGNRYLFSIDDQWTIDGSGRENTARYINHACEPNAKADVDPRARTVMIICAKRDIEPGEEIFIHYGSAYSLRPCKCEGCKGQRELNEDEWWDREVVFDREDEEWMET